MMSAPVTGRLRDELAPRPTMTAETFVDVSAAELRDFVYEALAPVEADAAAALFPSGTTMTPAPLSSPTSCCVRQSGDNQLP